MNGIVWVGVIAVLIVLWAIGAYGSDGGDGVYVDERWPDASICDRWGLDALQEAAERQSDASRR